MANIQTSITMRENMTSTFQRSAAAGRGLRDTLGGVREQATRTEVAFSTLKGVIGGFISGLASIYTIKQLADFTNDSVEACNKQIEAETKLSTVMSQRMGATAGQIQQIKDLTSAQQNLGVVGDEVQLAGAQQLSTFLNSTDALKTLIPAMNNLAVQQNGVNATSENMVNIGNLMGKVMQGQTSALTRVGITFTDAQEQVLKYGNEQERAAMLAQVITDNVGNMNAALANTPEGRVTQIKNAFGDMQETLGARVTPALMNFYDTIQANMPVIQGLMDSFANFATGVINGLTVITNGILTMTGFVQENWSIISPILTMSITLLTIYGGLLLAAHFGLIKVAEGQTLWNAVLASSPITWVVIGIAAVIAGIYAAVAAYNKATDSTVSATGVIVGTLTTAVAVVMNAGIGLYNFVVSQGVSLYNLIGSFANFFANVFNDPVTAIGNLFLDLFNYIVDTMKNAAGIIDAVLGSDISGSVGKWQAGINQSVQDIIGRNQNTVMPRASADDLTLDRINYADAYNWGYDKGKAIGDKVSSTIGDWFSGPDLSKYESLVNNPGLDLTGAQTVELGDDTADKIADIGDNTKQIARAMDITGTQLKYLFDVANREAVNRYTTASIKVDMTNHNNISKDMDVDGIVTTLKNSLEDQMQAVAEGAH